MRRVILPAPKLIHPFGEAATRFADPQRGMVFLTRTVFFQEISPPGTSGTAGGEQEFANKVPQREE